MKATTYILILFFLSTTTLLAQRASMQSGNNNAETQHTQQQPEREYSQPTAEPNRENYSAPEEEQRATFKSNSDNSQGGSNDRYTYTNIAEARQALATYNYYAPAQINLQITSIGKPAENQSNNELKKPVNPNNPPRAQYGQIKTAPIDVAKFTAVQHISAGIRRQRIDMYRGYTFIYVCPVIGCGETSSYETECPTHHCEMVWVRVWLSPRLLL